MEDILVCQMCGKESDEYKDFSTDYDNDVDIEEMTCESCYDDINEGI